MKNFKITATAPTSYQLNSLRAFHIGCNANGNGSYSGSMNFSSLEEAQSYLKDLADGYYDSQEAINWHLGKKSLTLDAVTAGIEEEEFFVIGVFAGRSEEYWAGQHGRLCDSEYEAARYDSNEDAMVDLDTTVKPYGESQEWENVTYYIL